MEKLSKLESQQENLLQMYQNQLKINTELRQEIEEMKQQIEDLRKGAPSESIQTDTIRELSDRESRKNNLLVFGCKEESDESNTNDQKIAQDIIKSVCPEISTDKIMVKRIGRPNAGKVRPIKVTLSSQREVRTIFFKAKELIQIPKYSHLALGLDKTANQLAEYRSLKNEMLKRIQNGETNIRIKYFRDVPKIIKVSNGTKN